MFGKRARCFPDASKFHLFCRRKKRKFDWKSLSVSFDLFVQPLRRYGIKSGKISIDNHTLAAQNQNRITEIARVLRRSHAYPSFSRIIR
jgi:hypothetical protein